MTSALAAAGHWLLEGGAVAGGVGMALGAYNRGNYEFDNDMRFERFMAGREFGIAQTNMYRKDLRKLTELTSKKMNLWCVSASLCMALDIALFCAGRLGLHGMSPPGWLAALWMTNNAASFCFMILTIWIAMHASFRSQACSVHLLTRKVRLPVPTLKQLDSARRLLSEFEQQDWGDIFRVPYVNSTGVPKDSLPGDISPRIAGRTAASKSSKQSHSKQTSWVRSEWELDRAGTITGPASANEVVPEHTVPEHFQLYAAAQKEWWPYEAYARVALLYGFLSFIQGLGYYGLGHIHMELRAFWAAYGCVFVIATLHALLLRFDIAPGRAKKQQFLPNCEYLGTLALFPAAIATTLEYRVEYSPTAVVISYLFEFAAIIMQLLYQLRLLELLLPDEWHQAPLEENIGFSWFPDSWNVPSSFQHILYLVAPPQRLAPGQHDIVRELKYGTGVQSSKPMSSEEIETQTKYLEDLFAWALSDAILSQLSTNGRQEVRALFDQFEKFSSPASPRRGSKRKVECSDTLRECYGGLNAVMTQEGICPQGLQNSSFESESPPPTPRSTTSSSDSKAPPPVATGKAIPHGNMRHVEPWRLLGMVLVAMCASWVLLFCGTLLECFIGEQGLVTAPHWSRPPMTRASLSPHELGTPYGGADPAGKRPWLPEQLAWHEEKRGAAVNLIGRGAGYPGIPRRLSGERGHSRQQGSAGQLLQNLFAALPAEVTTSASQMLRQAPTSVDAAGLSAVLSAAAHGGAGKAAAIGARLVAERHAWPAFFEPRLLACAPSAMNAVAGSRHAVAALSPRGFGAFAPLRGDSAEEAQAESFRLGGISHLPPLAGFSWSDGELGEDKAGLLLLSRAGHLLSCPGQRPKSGARWSCGPLGSSAPRHLPGFAEGNAGSRLLGGSAAWLRGPGGAGGEPRLHAAIHDERAPDVVALYMLENDADWMPLGEVPIPAAAGQRRVSISFANGAAGELLLGFGGGGFTRRRLRDGVVLQSQEASISGGGPMSSEWQAACGVPGSSAVAHLALRRHGAPGAAAQWRPEVSVAGELVAKVAEALEKAASAQPVFLE
eukprot:TRINITY_DN3744_c0_g1_i1.p1 TRINITY_DN3744_c0_g1~~TRINITY_DN3744_c0_g1_i1.p1  ORF type:complete len:1063 (+),score=252.02 TRINITY_DN3744_c0_g1_i1:118-3306(+)